MESKIKIESTRDSITVYISGKIKRWQESVLFSWVIMWTLCGIYILPFFFEDYSMEEKMFLLGYMVFWAYFEYMAVRSWVWRHYGVEMIRVTEGKLEVKNNIRGFGEVKRYFVENIKDLGYIESKATSFSATYFNSFWMVGGESISFSYMGKTVVFGKQLKADDARKIASTLKKYFKKKR